MKFFYIFGVLAISEEYEASLRGAADEIEFGTRNRALARDLKNG